METTLLQNIGGRCNIMYKTKETKDRVLQTIMILLLLSKQIGPEQKYNTITIFNYNALSSVNYLYNIAIK